MQLELDRIIKARDAQEKGTCITGGWIESIILNFQHPAREALLWKNSRFGDEVDYVTLAPSFIESGIEPLFMYPEIVDEVAKFIHVEKSFKTKWLAEAESRSSLLK